jgi:hypothetical protein
MSMLNVIMLSVIMLNVVAPQKVPRGKVIKFYKIYDIFGSLT